MKYLSAIFLSLLILSCVEKTSETTFSEENHTTENSKLQKGTWTVNCHINDSVNIPFRLEVFGDNKMSIVNHTECIQIEDIQYEGDSIFIDMPIFDSEFVGVVQNNGSFAGLWHNHLKKDYTIPFTASFLNSELFSELSETKAMKYDVTFSPDSESDIYKAIGLFNKGNNYSYGTFITETGDYRFLEGEINDDKISLSCFDGSHLFFFDADLKGDSMINGRFYSGKHWYEPWIAQLRDDAELRDPDSLTYLVDGYDTMNFTAQDLNGENVQFDRETYQDKITIIQIYGSWCPNCLDENLFYKELYQQFSSEGLQIIPVAFEPGEEFSEKSRLAGKHFDDLDMPYETYIGGQANKKTTSEKFPMLNKIISYPTSVFLDKSGNVRKIHTGFYGPGTGEYYKQYVMETKMFIRELLDEQI